MAWYILPNGNIRHLNGLELQPEHDWFPTSDSLASFTDAERDSGKSEAEIIKHMMALAIEGETWARENLS